jgi:hypothetical protein
MLFVVIINPINKPFALIVRRRRCNTSKWCLRGQLGRLLVFSGRLPVFSGVIAALAVRVDAQLACCAGRYHNSREQPAVRGYREPGRGRNSVVVVGAAAYWAGGTPIVAVKSRLRCAWSE